MNQKSPSLLLLVLALISSELFAKDHPAKFTSSSLREAVEAGDSAYRAFNYDLAIQKYEQATKENLSVDLLLKLSDAYFFGGYEKPKREQEKMYFNAKKVLLTAKQIDSLNSEVFARLGQVTGQIAIFKGNEEKIKLGLQIKEYADRALELNPNCAMAHAVLGIWHYELAGLSFFERTLVNVLFGGVPKGSYETSCTHLKKAVELAPNVIYYRYMFAKSLIKVDQEEEAKKSLIVALELPLLVAGDKRNKSAAKELLLELN
ncbi:MAG: hypothetical protein SFU91_08910 [Chloroherpetonaceae bacterium]|nr:hypothetical protein [Chloroherpetonaceae bacterium]